MQIPSMTAENIYPYLKSLGFIREWKGERVKQNLAKGEFRLGNGDYEQTVALPRNAVLEMTSTACTRPTSSSWAATWRWFPSQKVYGVLKSGFTTLGPDGQYFFDTDHPVGSPGSEQSVSNFMGGTNEAWYILDASAVVKPIIWQPRQAFNLVTLFNPDDPNVFWNREFVYGVDGRAGFGFSPYWQLLFASKQTLDETNVSATLTAMASQKDDDGQPFGLRGTHLICSPAMEERALKLFTPGAPGQRREQLPEGPPAGGQLGLAAVSRGTSPTRNPGEERYGNRQQEEGAGRRQGH